MDDEKLKRQIGANIAAHRKNAGLTQMGLAEKLNYSDKAVSKWERGESVPDVLTLMALAEQFGITVNDLVADPNALPEGIPNKLEKAMTQVSERALKRKANKNVIQALSSTLVWFVALFIFVIISSFDIPYSWISFIYAIPVNAAEPSLCMARFSLESALDFHYRMGLSRELPLLHPGFLPLQHVEAFPAGRTRRNCHHAVVPFVQPFQG